MEQRVIGGKININNGKRGLENNPPLGDTIVLLL